MNTSAAQAIDRSGSVLDYCRLHGVTIQAWSPLQHGMFEGPFLISPKYAELNAEIARLAEQYGVTSEAIAIAWILRHPAKMQAIVGTMNPQRISGLAKAENVWLTRQEWYGLYKAAGNPIP